MRQRLQKFLPIVLIALMVQVLAPIGATWAAAMAADDPVGAAQICHSGPIAPLQSDQSGGHRDHGGACEPGTPGKGSERPLRDDQPLKPGDRVEQAPEAPPQRPRPISPGGAGDVKRVEQRHHQGRGAAGAGNCSRKSFTSSSTRERRIGGRLCQTRLP